ncbi:MAG: hypothetical protein N2560_06180 [Ignavibacteria bacterium]|nr:hypothetical protein [Ignavibacteria bacterium]
MRRRRKIEMVKKITINLVVFFFAIYFLDAQGVSLDNTGGKINNLGTIRVRAGQVKNLNDTIDGRFEYTATCPAFTQEVPNIIYNQLVISGSALKVIDTVRKVGNQPVPLITRDSLLLIDSARINLFRGDVWALGPVANSSLIFGNKEFRLAGNTWQEIWGNGNFPILHLDNPYGAVVARGGGFKVDYQLILSRGEFKNSLSNNFSLGDSAKIVRYFGSSLTEAPLFGKRVDVEYRGDGKIVSGAELPTDEKTLGNLEVNNTKGLVLSQNVTVNDTLRLRSNIYTEPNDTTKFTLTLSSSNNPEFVDINAEIDGSFRRTNLKADSSKIVFNNAYTYLIFPDEASKNGASEVTFRVKPRTFPPFPFGENKVKRHIFVVARNSLGNTISEFNPIFGYGWRHSKDTSVNETNGLDAYKLKLQWWDGTNWVNVGEEDIVQFDTLNGWAYNVVKAPYSIKSGDFAIGTSFFYPLAFKGKAILEGAWRGNGMRNDLRSKNLIPKTPPNVFPYNRDPQRENIVVNSIPDSVVDWVVLEFRRSLNDPNPIVYTCFLAVDGKIIGRNGEYPITNNEIQFDTSYSSYHIAILHRNHLAVVTEEKVDLIRKPILATIDFTKPELVMGRENALRPLAKTPEGLVFGLPAGDVNGDGVVDIFDQIGVWTERDFEGYYIWDTNLDGIITTRDLNYSINNRGRKTFLP